MAKDDSGTYSEEEAQRRFEALVKAALNTPPEHKTKAKGSKAKAAKGK
jgi:hypothetical protein